MKIKPATDSELSRAREYARTLGPVQMSLLLVRTLDDRDRLRSLNGELVGIVKEYESLLKNSDYDGSNGEALIRVRAAIKRAEEGK
jgi:hypothetical protein